MVEGTVLDNFKLYPMLVKGSTALPFEPYYSGIKSATATKITSTGGNLSQISVLTTYNSFIGNIVAGVTYTFSCYFNSIQSFNLRYNSIDGTNIITAYDKTGYYSTTFTSEYTTELWFNGFNYTPDMSNITLNVGSSAIDFEPYVSSEFDIPSEIQTLDGYGIGLSTTDKTYMNYIDFENKQFVQNQKKIKLTSDLVWKKITTGTIDYFQYYNAESISETTTSSNKYLCSDFPNAYIGTSDTEDGTGVMMASGRFFRFRNSNTNNTTLDEWKAYLDANEIYLVYTLATPVVTDISAYIVGDTYKVWRNGTETFDSDVAPTLDSTYFVSRITEVN